MKHGAVRKLTRAAALSFLVLATTSSVAGLEVVTAGSAMADPAIGSDPGTGSGDNGGNNGGATGGNNGGGGDLVGNLLGGKAPGL